MRYGNYHTDIPRTPQQRHLDRLARAQGLPEPFAPTTSSEDSARVLATMSREDGERLTESGRVMTENDLYGDDSDRDPGGWCFR